MVEHAVIDLTDLPTGGENEDHPMARLMGEAHAAARRDRFVVGMSVEEHQAGHGASEPW
jgi:hypothetical protein